MVSITVMIFQGFVVLFIVATC